MAGRGLDWLLVKDSHVLTMIMTVGGLLTTALIVTGGPAAVWGNCEKIVTLGGALWGAALLLRRVRGHLPSHPSSTTEPDEE